MAIKSHPFGRVTLTGDDAKEFAKQVLHGQANQAAEDALRKGRIMVKEFKSTGKVNITLSKPSRVKNPPRAKR